MASAAAAGMDSPPVNGDLRDMKQAGELIACLIL
jgi:hypothetical protein